jgi:hypothetical protein
VLALHLIMKISSGERFFVIRGRHRTQIVHVVVRCRWNAQEPEARFIDFGLSIASGRALLLLRSALLSSALAKPFAVLADGYDKDPRPEPAPMAFWNPAMLD